MDLKKNYILIAEDDEDDRMLLKSAFNESSEEIDLIFVENGVELIAYFKDFENGSINSLPSLLILDLNMPKKNGKEVLAELQLKKYYSDFKTVIFSTTNCETEKGKCHEYDIAGYFVKPTGYKALLQIVSEFKVLAGFTEKAFH